MEFISNFLHNQHKFKNTDSIEGTLNQHWMPDQTESETADSKSSLAQSCDWLPLLSQSYCVPVQQTTCVKGDKTECE